jgi:[acyl-carrier-protein] S-malonyltransferase
VAGALTALCFPGQGSQAVGMGTDLRDAYTEAAAIFAAADDILGRPLSKIIFEGPEEALKETINTQLAVFVMNHVCYSLYTAEGGVFDFAMGHSLGEYNALVAAGCMDFETALKLVEKRATFMNEQAAVREGKMLAVLGLSDEEVAIAFAKFSGHGVAEMANYNCPGQVVISGDGYAMDEMAELLKEAGAKKIVPLKVSGAFHSPLMAEAERRLIEVLETLTFNDAIVPVCSNFTGLLSTDGEALKQVLHWQMTMPVQWTKSVETVLAEGAGTFVEAGPGRVLAGLIKRIAPEDVEIINVNSVETLEAL